VSRGARDYAELLRSGLWFRGLPEELQARLLDAASVVSVEAETTIFRIGDAPSGIYALLDGTVRIATRTAANREVLLLLAKPPSWFGEISALDGQPRAQDATAVGDVRLVHVDQRSLDAILTAWPTWWRHLAALMAAKLRLALIAIADEVATPPGLRLARWIASMAQSYGDSALPRRSIQVRQDELAAMANVSRQTANALLKDLEARGLIRIAYGAIEIVDLAGLIRLTAGQ